MIHARANRPASVIPALAFALLLALTVAGCGSKVANTTSTAAPTGVTAKTALSAATSALSTTAPDAKLLLLQTEGAVTATSAPVWSYLFGSPKDDKTYIVLVKDGKAMPASEYGTAGLEKAEWAKVPGADAWKIDSDAAYKTAQAACGAEATAAYTIGLITHIPEAETTSTTKPLVWYVSFDPASSASTGTVQVDAKTGEVIAK